MPLKACVLQRETRPLSGKITTIAHNQAAQTIPIAQIAIAAIVLVHLRVEQVPIEAPPL